MYEAFGVLCPGCGGTRALAALLRGQLRQAFGFNALVTVAALIAGPAFLACAIAPQQLSQVCLRRWQQPLVSVGLVVAGVFTIWRNLR